MLQSSTDVEVALFTVGFFTVISPGTYRTALKCIDISAALSNQAVAFMSGSTDCLLLTAV